MSKHYFVAAALPAVILGRPPEISFSDFMTLLRENFSSEEMRCVEAIRSLIDIYNIAAFLKGQSLDPRGSVTQLDIEEALSTQAGLSDYILEFFQSHGELEEQLRAHGELVVRYFQVEIPKARGFLREYLKFEREWRLVMIGFRAAKLGREIARELQWEDPADPLVAHLLAQQHAKSFEPPEEYERLKRIFESHQDDPWDLQMALERYRFERVSEMIELETFSLDYVLGYMVQLMIAEKWQELHDKQSVAISGS